MQPEEYVEIAAMQSVKTHKNLVMKFIRIAYVLSFLAVCYLWSAQEIESDKETSFHMNKMIFFWNKLTDSEGTHEQESYILKFKNHQKALVEIGYFRHIKYKVASVLTDKKKISLIAELNKAIGNIKNGYFEGPDLKTKTLNIWFSSSIAGAITRLEEAYELKIQNQ
jgi:hypothetical protein